MPSLLTARKSLPQSEPFSPCLSSSGFAHDILRGQAPDLQTSELASPNTASPVGPPTSTAKGTPKTASKGPRACVASPSSSLPFGQDHLPCTTLSARDSSQGEGDRAIGIHSTRVVHHLQGGTAAAVRAALARNPDSQYHPVRQEEQEGAPDLGEHPKIDNNAALLILVQEAALRGRLLVSGVRQLVGLWKDLLTKLRLCEAKGTFFFLQGERKSERQFVISGNSKKGTSRGTSALVVLRCGKINFSIQLPPILQSRQTMVSATLANRFQYLSDEVGYLCLA